MEYLCIPISLQVSRSVSWSGVVKHSTTAFPSGPGAGRKRLRASTSFLTIFSSPPMTTSGRPLRRQNTAWWENEFCLTNLRALSPAFLLLFLSERVLPWTFWVGEGGSEEPLKLVQSDASSTLSSLRGAQGGDHRSTSARATGRAKFTWRSGTDCTVRQTSDHWGVDSTASSTNDNNNSLLQPGSYFRSNNNNVLSKLLLRLSDAATSLQMSNEARNVRGSDLLFGRENQGRR